MLGFIGYWLSTLLLALALLGVVVIWGFIIVGVIAEVKGFFKEKEDADASSE